MNTQSIFDSWATFPKIFDVKPITLNFTGKRFYLCPNKLNGISMILLLKTRFGICLGTKHSFKTPYLKLNKSVVYNGYNLTLILEDDKAIMEIEIQGKQFQTSCWELKDIASLLKKKNKDNPLITEMVVKQLLLDGKLKVKFNVDFNKDHGTLWVVED